MNTIIAEGECGRSGNARWQLDDTGRLTISGTGSTSVYSFSIPWEKYIDKITCVTYMEGITDISDDLSGMINVRRLELSSTVTSIFGRFENCSKLSLNEFKNSSVPTKGDINGDGVVGVDDAQTVLVDYVETKLTGLESSLTDLQKHARDINGDQLIDVYDAQLIIEYYVYNMLSDTPTTWEDLLYRE